MKLITPWSLVLGLLLAGPALVQAWSDPSGDLTGAMLRFVLGTLVAGMGLAVVGGLVDLYRPTAEDSGSALEEIDGDLVGVDGESSTSPLAA